ESADAERRAVAADHPLVRAIMEAFPGARIEGVHDETADMYGLARTRAGPNDAETVNEVLETDE
ncbi:MAG: hypothetical protein JOY71_10785, partial [Acetobacteraceae bacterium]|nr:hypothetical protein [Acetobacteraceae bacterium]